MAQLGQGADRVDLVSAGFTPGVSVHPPSGKRARAQANLAALSVLTQLETDQRLATGDEQAVLARWSAWGALPEVFEPWRDEWADIHSQVSDALSPEEVNAAATTTINAHYTRPDIAQVMWESMERAGFTGGKVLEPGCGSGTFMGLAPKSADLVGVELDPVTARIASALYPAAHVRNEGFEATRIADKPTSTFAAAIGNVPFGGFSLHDPLDNRLGLSIHNHFIAKSLRHTAPGGYVMMLTSSWTMDAKTSTARREISKYADFLGAVRLPTGAMSRVAGTDAVTDILVLRRRPDDAEVWQDEPKWHTAIALDDTQSDSAFYNSYWKNHPGHVIGEMTPEQSMYGTGGFAVTHDDVDAIATDVREVLFSIVDQAIAADRSHDPVALERDTLFASPGLHTPDPVERDRKVGTLTFAEGRFERWDGFEWHTETIAAAKRQETIALLQLRDAASRVISTQQDGLDEPAKEAARAHLDGVYEAYVGKYGPINRFTLGQPRTPTAGKIDKHVAKETANWRRQLTGLTAAERALEEPPTHLVDQWRQDLLEQAVAPKLQPHLTGLRGDPDFALVLALEAFDEDTGTASKTQIFTNDVISSSPPRQSAANPADALAISLDETRGVDIDRISELLSIDPGQVPTELSGLIFANPAADGAWEAAVTYLSGDVRSKLTAARTAAADDPTYQDNVAALEAVLPSDIALTDVTLHPGMRWLPKETVPKFIDEVLGATATVSFVEAEGRWTIDGPARSKFAHEIQLAYAMPTRSPLDMLEAVMNNAPVTITKTDADGNVSRDVKATKAARAKCEQLTRAFTTWVHEDTGRVSTLQEMYNARFNSHVAPDFTTIADQMRFDGLSATYTPHPYQRTAVAQILHTPTTLLDHVVGAGKSGTMFMAAMELRRTGLAKKPWIVVPNHLVDQVATEFRSWYPAANILPVPTGLGPDQRREYVARSAASDWDAVICPASVFELINVDPERSQAWLAEEVEQLRANVDQLPESATKRRYRKKIEADVKRAEAAHADAIDNKDTGLTFEASGCDYVFIDEAHNYKNLKRVSAHPELAQTGSARATDLSYKLRALREAKTEAHIAAGGNPEGYLPAVATFATGTPVANSLSEKWVMATYLRPDLLKAMGIDTVDSWAAQFTTSTSKMEISADGRTWKLRTRIGEFVNVPELLAIDGQYTSTVLRDDITVALPAIHGGTRQIISRQASPHVSSYIDDLAERANNLPSDPSEDNLLKISHEGRMIALDPRTLGLEGDGDGGRVGMIAEQIMRIHHNTATNSYPEPGGATSPLPGGLQIVFCDRSTPTDDGSFSLYQALREDLVGRGMDEDKIRFIHEASNDTERAELFAAARNGHINVLIGSTEKMGTGANVQTRVTAIHHADCPWRPADLEQREGRGVRQGNHNDEIEILQYVTEGTYDAFFWQTVSRKANFIHQLKTGTITSRTVADIDDDMRVSAAAASAIATGDPRIIERAELIETIAALEAVADTRAKEVAAMRHKHTSLRSETANITEFLAAANTAQATATANPLPTDGTAITIGQQRHTTKADAGTAIIAELTRLRDQLKHSPRPLPIATVAGLTVTATRSYTGRIQLSIQGLDPYVISTLPESASTWSPLGVATRIDNLPSQIPTAIDDVTARLTTATREAENLGATLAGMSESHDELATMRLRLEEIDESLALTDTGEDAPATVDRVDGVDIELLTAGNKTNLYGLRPGDIVTKVPSHPGFWEHVNDREFINVDDPDAPPIHLTGEGILVSRRRDQLTALEAHQIDKQITGKLERWIRPGATISCIHPDTNQPISGKVTATSGNHYRSTEPSSLTIVNDQGRHELTFDGQDFTVLVHDHMTRDVVALCVGDQATATTAGIPEGAIVTTARTWDITFTHPTSGKTYRATNEQATTIPTIKSRMLDVDELTAAGLPVPTAIEELRPGDLVTSTDIDPKQPRSFPVQLTDVPQYAGIGDYTWKAVEPRHGHGTIRRKSGADITVQGRPLAALTDMERRKLANPAVELTTATAVADKNLTCAADTHQGTVIGTVYSDQRHGHYGGAAYTIYMIKDRTGRDHTLQPGAQVAVYQGDPIAVPENISVTGKVQLPAGQNADADAGPRSILRSVGADLT